MSQSAPLTLSRNALKQSKARMTSTQISHQATRHVTISVTETQQRHHRQEALFGEIGKNIKSTSQIDSSTSARRLLPRLDIQMALANIRLRYQRASGTSTYRGKARQGGGIRGGSPSHPRGGGQGSAAEARSQTAPRWVPAASSPPPSCPTAAAWAAAGWHLHT